MNGYEEVAERDMGVCRGCGHAGYAWGRPHIHHIVFRSHGGPDEAWNLITLCKRCHDRAHRLDREVFYPAWLLQRAVENLNILAEIELLRVRAAKSCGDCHYNNPANWTCLLFDYQDTAVDFGCDAWVCAG